jgi:hypothetical protein
MDRVGSAAMVTAAVFVATANLAGSAMARLLNTRTGKTYRPSAANMELARHYRENFGPDRNYVVYGVSHFAVLALVLIAALFIAFSN